jgi:dienelactone hydrolase
MRSRFSFSSLIATTLALAACGAQSTHDPFSYDRSSPLAERDGAVIASGAPGSVRSVSFAGAGGSRLGGYLLVPRSAGRHPAVLFLHGSGGSRSDLLGVAAELMVRGVVTLTISQPNDAQSFRPLVVNARRALDLLTRRKDVDAHRLGLVGFSLGAQTAAILAGDDDRLRAVGIISGRGSPVPLYWIRRTHADLSFEAGTHDEVVPHAQLVALIRAAPGQPRVRWYDTPHGMNRRAFEDMIDWQAHDLGLGLR